MVVLLLYVLLSWVWFLFERFQVHSQIQLLKVNFMLKCFLTNHNIHSIHFMVQRQLFVITQSTTLTEPWYELQLTYPDITKLLKGDQPIPYNQNETSPYRKYIPPFHPWQTIERFSNQNETGLCTLWQQYSEWIKSLVRRKENALVRYLHKLVSFWLYGIGWSPFSSLVMSG